MFFLNFLFHSLTPPHLPHHVCIFFRAERGRERERERETDRERQRRGEREREKERNRERERENSCAHFSISLAHTCTVTRPSRAQTVFFFFFFLYSILFFTCIHLTLELPRNYACRCYPSILVVRPFYFLHLFVRFIYICILFN